MMSYTRKDSHNGAYHPGTSLRCSTWASSHGHHIYSVKSPSDHIPERSRLHYRDTDSTSSCHAAVRTASHDACAHSDAPRLPSLNELFASKVLIAPGTGSPHECVPECPGLPPLRKSSIGSSTNGSPTPTSATSSHPDQYSDSESDTQRDLAIRLAARSGRHYSPSSSAAAFGKDGNFRPIRTDSVADISEPVYNSVWPSTAALYADPEFKPSGAGFTAEYKGIKSVPGFGNYHVYEGGFCIPTHIDGEAVNPVWGLTKSKNPRKRLPIACGWCRRKKIRCEPSGDGCLQCKKAKRPCEM